MGGACVTPAERVCERALPAGCGDGDRDGDGALTAANRAATLRGGGDERPTQYQRKFKKLNCFGALRPQTH